MLSFAASEWWPSGRKDMTGRVVRVSSMKLRDAQKRPDKALTRFFHLCEALNDKLALATVHSGSEILRKYALIVCISIKPRPQLNPSASLSRAVPRPRTPTLGVPSPEPKPQMELLCIRVLQDLAE